MDMRTTTDGLIDLAIEALRAREQKATEARRQVIDVACPRNVPHDWSGPGAGDVAAPLGYAASLERDVGRAEAILHLAGAELPDNQTAADVAAPEPRRSRR